MIKEFEKLTPEEQELLFQAPVLLSVLVSCSHTAVSKARKNDAVKLAHLRTFTAPPQLQAYYQEVDKRFKEDFERTVQHFYPFDEERRAALKKEVERVSRLLDKLDKPYAEALGKSLDSYARHVRRSDYSVFSDVIFPIAYSRLNDPSAP